MASSLSGGIRSVATSSRSVYVSRLRRAFLLRAHPDRFQSFESVVRQRQETLVKAISNRMSQPDFLAFTYGENSSDGYSRKDEGMLHFSLIRKDGSLMHQTLDLNQPVEDVLHNMASALTLAGAVSMPPPPSAPKVTTMSDQSRYNIHWATQSNNAGVDRRYDIHSIRGRDLLSFLQHLDMDQVQSRRSHRLDVTAAALVVRQKFGFSAVDGTGLGWSSASVAILLRSLSAFHIEHCKKLIPTFYPFRLVWSSGDYDNVLDVYGGIVYLNPASTPIQWLQHLLIVTDSKLAEHKLHQASLAQNINIIASHLGVKLVKGHSCESQHYHDLVGRLAHSLGDPSHNPTNSSAVALERVHVTAESAQICRRPIVTKEGNIRIGTNMSTESIILGISQYAPEARKRLRESRASLESCKATINRAYSELGLERVIPVKPVIVQDMAGALQRLLQLRDRDVLRNSLTGNILAFASTGQFCHVGDDGSFVIPLDWH